MGKHRLKPGLVRLTGLGAAKTALVGAGTGAGRAAPAVFLSGKVAHTLAAKVRPVAGKELVIGDGARGTTAHVLDFVGVELGGTAKKSDGPAARLVIEHTTVEVDLRYIIRAGAAAVGRDGANLEGTGEVVTSHVRNTDGANEAARLGLVPLQRVLPDVKVLTVKLTVARVTSEGGKLGAVLEVKTVGKSGRFVLLHLNTGITTVSFLHTVMTESVECTVKKHKRDISKESSGVENVRTRLVCVETATRIELMNSTSGKVTFAL